VTPQFTNSSANRTGIVGVATFKRWTPTGAGTAKLQYNGVDSSVTFTGASQFFITTFTVSGTYPASAPVIGMKSTGSGAVSVLYDCGVIVAYIPGAAPFLPQPPFIKQQAVQRAAFN
jgi:hypothetical protein